MYSKPSDRLTVASDQNCQPLERYAHRKWFAIIQVYEVVKARYMSITTRMRLRNIQNICCFNFILIFSFFLERNRHGTLGFPEIVGSVGLYNLFRQFPRNIDVSGTTSISFANVFIR